MADEMGFDFGQDDAEVMAFVLRVRQLRDDDVADRLIVDLTDTRSMHTQRLTSLEDAFASIRGAVEHSGESSGPSDETH